MSKMMRPKTWYLLGIGAAALLVDGARRLVKRRRQEAEWVEFPGEDIPMRSYELEEEEIAVEAPAAPKTTAVDVKPAESEKASARKPAAEKKAQPDDLTQIKGIGPVYAARLAEAGLTTFAAIAAATPERLREVTQAMAAANPEEWIEQARGK